MSEQWLQELLYSQISQRLLKKTAVLVCLLIYMLSVTVSLAQESEIVRHQIYGYRDGMAMYYDVEIPENPNGLGVVFIVSGGFVSGEANLNISRPFWSMLIDEGYTLFEIYHPAMPAYRIPDAFSALQQGIQHIQENSFRFGVDNERLGIFGISSGGHLALLLGMSIDPEKRSALDFNAIVAIMPIVDVRNIDSDESLFGARHMDFDPVLIPAVSPVDHVTKDDPPTLLIHGTRDQAVDFEQNSLRMAALLERHGVANRLLAVDAGHEVFPESYLERARSTVLEWLEEHL